jgi:mono/diheme cytochrome c family protein
MTTRAAGLALGAALLLPSFAVRPAAHDPITTKVTFTREIRAILGARCVTCHSPRGSAPMPLTTYAEVRPWARAIKEQVLTRRMPKWHAARGFGAFANDPTLTPLESALIVSWVDGGLPEGVDGVSGVPRVVPTPRPAAWFRRDTDKVLTVPATAAQAAMPTTPAWISGWLFEAGDPLIASATFASSSGVIGTWVAGDAPVVLPGGGAVRVTGEIRVEVQRRASADYEQAVTRRASVLRLRVAETDRPRRVWTEQIACGSTPARAGSVIGVRPLLAKDASARIWIQRPGAPAAIVGWFRDFDPAFARTYWLARPLDAAIDTRLQSDGNCLLQLTLAARPQ